MRQGISSLDSLLDIASRHARTAKTIRLMAEIDETIEKHGGWPIA